MIPPAGSADSRPVLRHPTEDDQPAIAAVVDWWFGGQHTRHLLVRAWFRHFGSSSWLAVAGPDPASAPIGFLVGYRSQDQPGEAVIHLVAVDPNYRRRGIGRALVAAFVAQATATGATVARATAWPGEPIATTFFLRLGFEAEAGAASRNLFGTPAYPDHEGAGEDRVVFLRRLG